MLAIHINLPCGHYLKPLTHINSLARIWFCTDLLARSFSLFHLSFSLSFSLYRFLSVSFSLSLSLSIYLSIPISLPLFLSLALFPSRLSHPCNSNFCTTINMLEATIDFVYFCSFTLFFNRQIFIVCSMVHCTQQHTEADEIYCNSIREWNEKKTHTQTPPHRLIEKMCLNGHDEDDDDDNCVWPNRMHHERGKHQLKPNPGKPNVSIQWTHTHYRKWN